MIAAGAAEPAARAGTRIVLVAGETSGDNLGAGLIASLRARRPELRFEGVAGPRMVAAGCMPWASIERLSVMGLFEVVRHLPDLLALRRQVERRALAAPTAAFIGIDSPEFNLSLAARLKRNGIPTVQYVSPQVWAWRQGRVARMTRTLDLVLCLLPFEKAFYDATGPTAEFVGHPLADRLPLHPDRAAARAELGIGAGETLIALLPGSRAAEVERLGADFIAAANWLQPRRPGVRFIAPMANARVRALFAALRAQRGPGLALELIDGGADRVLTAADAALVASGTATLEALLCRCPMVVAYRVSRATAGAIGLLGLMKTPFFAQPNLLAGRRVVPEFKQADVVPARLGAELFDWLDDRARVAALVQEFDRIHVALRQGASERAAEAVLALLDRGSAQARA